MKLIITGGCGFIGSNLIIHLIDKLGFEVINIDNLSYSSNLHFINKIETYKRAAPSISFGKLVARGDKNKQARNKTPIVRDVIPVLPPAFTPAPDST